LLAQGGRDKALKPSIVITELPYQTNKSDFVATVARLVEEQKLTGAFHLSCMWISHGCKHPLRMPTTHNAMQCPDLQCIDVCCRCFICHAGISDVRDESDREGMRVVVEVKRGSSAEVCFCQLLG
jgi:DNA gyrase/topoisomerase IV subunit A